ncbi:MAG: TIGR04283 family arsenosugar biosynthesis glycosyltransferase, partial [Candidatus Hydrogenedentales bacterium]
KHGARVVHEPRRGYGAACLRGLAALGDAEVVVFLDGDHSDHPEQMDRLVDPVVADQADLVIGSRSLGTRESGALAPHARFGNWLACRMIRLFWGVRYTDLGPFRAIRRSALDAMHLADPNYGWTVEMQVKAAMQRLRIREVPVDYRPRIGRSKVTGTLRGVIGAAYKIIGTILLHAARQHLHRGTSLSKSNPNHRVVVFTRFPVAGETKTRLIPALGAGGAADCQREMTEHVLAAVEGDQAMIEIRYTGADEAAMRARLGGRRHYAEQGAGDLGERMARAFHDAFDAGCDRAVLIGVDCPDLCANLIDAAFNLLHSQPIALGPAVDGGYYLIGLRREAAHALPRLFDGVHWGGPEVRAQTEANARSLGLKTARLALLRDVDVPGDLGVWKRAQRRREKNSLPDITVVIPALNEATRIAAVVEAARRDAHAEVIVVDGGSHDDTAAIAQAAGAIVLNGTRGRGPQMNRGAAEAAGRLLLFVHGDTTLPEDYGQEVRRLLATEGVAAGAFRFATDDTSPMMRFFEKVAHLRSTLLRAPYGDQGLFVTRQTFLAVGGYQEWPLMEDYQIVQRLRQRGRIAIAERAAVTSARRWRRRGRWRTFFINQLIMLGYHAGISPARLARLYRQREDTNEVVTDTAAQAPCAQEQSRQD